MEGVNLMDDVRTPINYFTSPQEQVDAFRRINERLDVLVEKLEALKAKRKQGTPAEKKIRENEIEKAELRRYRRKGLDDAGEILDLLSRDDVRGAGAVARESLNWRCNYRIEPVLEVTGEEIEEQVFWSDDE